MKRDAPRRSRHVLLALLLLGGVALLGVLVLDEPTNGTLNGAKELPSSTTATLGTTTRVQSTPIARREAVATVASDSTGTPVELEARLAALRSVLGWTGVDVSGRVVDHEGQPVADARISVDERHEIFYGSRCGTGDLPNTPGMPWYRATAKTDADGRFVLVGVKAGDRTIHAYATPGQRAKRLVSVRPERVTSEVELRLPVPGRVVGVATRGGKPATGLWVVAWSVDEHPAWSVESDGSFELHDLPAGTHELLLLEPQRSLRAWSPSGPQLARCAVTVQSGEVSRAELSTADAVRIQGVVRRAGVAVAGAAFHMRSIGGATDTLSSQKLTTDAEGRYMLEVSPGQYVVSESTRFPNETVGWHSTDRVVVTVPDRDATHDITLHAGAITGRIDDADGGPLERVQLSLLHTTSHDSLWKLGELLQAGSAYTGADGRFRMGGVAAGSYRLVARKDDYAPQVLDVYVADGAPVDQLVRLEREVRMPIELVDAQGQPIPAVTREGIFAIGDGLARVRVIGGSQLPGVAGYLAQLAAGRDDWLFAGRVNTVRQLAPNHSYVLLVVPDDPAWAPTRVDLHVADPPQPTRVVLGRSGALEVLVTDAAGTPLANATVALRAPDGGVAVATRRSVTLSPEYRPTDQTGRVHCPQVAPGEHRVRVEVGARNASSLCRIEAKQTTTLEIRLP